MSGPIPAGYETDEDDYEAEMYGLSAAPKPYTSFNSYNNTNTPTNTIRNPNDVTYDEPFDWQSAIQSSSMNDSRSNEHNDTTLHSANSRLQDTTSQGNITNNSNQNNSGQKKSTYNPFDEYKVSDGKIDLTDLNDRGLPDEDIDDNQSIPPHGHGENLKIYGDLELFLCYIKEDDLIELFDKHEVTFRQLLTCNEQDLTNIGINKVGIRKKILEAISQVHARKWEPTSLTDLTAQDLYTSPGVYLVLSDIKKHQEYIKDTIVHLKTKMQADDEILELGKDFVGVKKIFEESTELIEASKELHLAAVDFADYIKKEKLDLPQLGPANYIDQDYINRTFRKKRPMILGYAIGFTLLIGFVAFKVTRS